MMGFFIYCGSVLIASIAQMLLKKSALKKHEHFVGSYLNPLVIMAYLMLVISMVLTSIAYRTVPLSLGPLIETLGIVFVAFFSRIFFKEQITRNYFIGLTLIMIGVVVAYG